MLFCAYMDILCNNSDFIKKITSEIRSNYKSSWNEL